MLINLLHINMSKNIKFIFHKLVILSATLTITVTSYAQNESKEVSKTGPKLTNEAILENQKKLELFKIQQERREERKRPLKYQYTYIDRKHSFNESLNLIGAMYGLAWLAYPLSQPKVVRDKGSWKKYKNNFGKLVFDQDEPFWNWFVHPISGSQLYLFYRANGYTRINAMGMTFISSALFEFTVEIYTEAASVQDLYQTPVLGSFLGVGLESLSLYLLHTDNSFGKILGHILNPSTLFWFYEGKIQIVPQTNFKDKNGLLMTMEF